MRVLVACEYSGILTAQLRRVGIEAFSCDLLPTEGPYPQHHYQQDVTPLLMQSWDAVIAFPPCTHLASSGARYFAIKRETGLQQEAINFFMACVNANAPIVAVENPIGIMSTIYRKPDQIIHPYQFGHKLRKSTCLWLKNLPPLTETNNVYSDMLQLSRYEQDALRNLPPSSTRAKLRSKTFEGIASAMADQWFSAKGEKDES